MAKYNFWFFSSFLIAVIVALPVITVFFSFFSETSNYLTILKNTFLFDYINNTLIILIFVLSITFLLGVISAYFVSFYEFPLCNFFSWALILAFAVPGYIFAFSIIAFFENYGTAYSILTNMFGEYNYNPHIPKLDGMLGSIIAISFSLFPYVYVLTRSSFFYQSNNYIEVGQNLGLSERETLCKISPDYSLFAINVRFQKLSSILKFQDALDGLKRSLEGMDQKEVDYFGGNKKVDKIFEFIAS